MNLDEVVAESSLYLDLLSRIRRAFDAAAIQGRPGGNQSRAENLAVQQLLAQCEV